MKKSGNVTRGQSIRPVSEIGEKPPNPTSGKRRRKTKRPNKTSVYPEDLAPRDALSFREASGPTIDLRTGGVVLTHVGIAVG